MKSWIAIICGLILAFSGLVYSQIPGSPIGGGAAGSGSCSGNLCSVTASANALTVLGETFAQMRASLGLGTGTTANLPATCNAGDTYFSTDGKAAYVCDTTSPAHWSQWWQLGSDGAWRFNLGNNTTYTTDTSGYYLLFAGGIPKIDMNGTVQRLAYGGSGLYDSNDVQVLTVTAVSTSTTNLNITASTTSNHRVNLTAASPSVTNIDLNLASKGSGLVTLTGNGGIQLTASGNNITANGMIFDSTGNQITPAGTTTLQVNSALVATGGINTTPITPQAYDGHAAASPTAANLSGTIVTNYNQAAADVSITGPTLAAGMNFIMIVGTARSNYWRYTSTTTNVYLDNSATAVTYVGFAAPAVGNAISCFSFQTGASTYCLKCTTLSGTSTSG